jgi:hypothetical protein
MLSHGLVIASTGSHPSLSSSPSFLPSASSPGVRVSNSFFFISGAFYLAPFALFSVKPRAAFQLIFLANMS